MGFGLYIGLVISTGPTRYVNNDNGDKMRLFTSLSQVRQTLWNVSGVKGVKHFPELDTLKRPYVNKVYKKVLTSKPHIRKQERAELNARQYRMLQFCGNWPEAINDSVIFVRMREDIMITHVKLAPIIKMVIDDDKIVTSDCDTYRGINDRMAFGPASVAKSYFDAPSEYYSEFNRSNVQRYNTEQLYKDAIEAHGMTIEATDQFFLSKAVTKVDSRWWSKGRRQEKVCNVAVNPFQVDAPGNELCPKNVGNEISYMTVCYRQPDRQ